MAVKLMIQYLYQLEYSIIPAVGEMPTTTPLSLELQRTLDDYRHAMVLRTNPMSGALTYHSMPAAPVVPTNTFPCSSIHARVYALAEKYGIPGLKTLALEYFKSSARFQWDTDEFMRAIEVAYMGTPDPEGLLRNAVVTVIGARPAFLDKPAVQEWIPGIEGLSFDLLQHFYELSKQNNPPPSYH